MVSTLGNNKPLGMVTDTQGRQQFSIQRAFVVTVSNPATTKRSVMLHIASQPPVALRASFLEFSPLIDLPVKVAAKTTIAREVFVTSTDRSATVAVTVEDVAGVTTRDCGSTPTSPRRTC